MQNLRHFSLALLVLVSFIVTGCGGGSSGSSSGTPGETTSEVSGLASAPPNTVAQLEPVNFFKLALEFVFPPLAAAITGLEPITGADVELIRVDNQGNQVGDVIATTTTSATGNYTLTLPAGVELSGNLVVRIGATANAQLRSQVVSRTVNISPVSEYILQKFIERGADLQALPLNTVLSLSGKVAEFDIAAQSGDSLDALLTRLEQDAGDLVNSQIDLAKTDQAVATALNGLYQGTNLTFVLGDSDDFSPGSFEAQVFKDTFELEAQGSGNVNVAVTEGAALYAQLIGSDNSASNQANSETRLGDGGQDTIPATYTADNVLTIQAPFNEEIEATSGFRSPPTDFRFQAVKDMGLMFAAPAELLVRYGLDGTDAIDVDQKLGEELKRGLIALVRTPTAATTADLSGVFGRVYMGAIISDSGQIEAEAEASTITFNGSAGTLDASATTRYSFTRANNATVTYGTESALAEAGIPFSVSANGAIGFDGGAPNGYVDEDFRFVAEANLTTATDELDAEIGPFMSSTLLLKLPTATKDVSGKRYSLFSSGMGVGVGTAGDITITGSRSDSSLEMGTLAQGETQATRNLSISVARKASLEGQVVLSQFSSSLPVEVSVGANGATTMVVVDGTRTTTYEGFFNGEGTLGIFMVRVNDGGDNNQLALAVLVEQP